MSLNDNQRGKKTQKLLTTKTHYSISYGFTIPLSCNHKALKAPEHEYIFSKHSRNLNISGIF